MQFKVGDRVILANIIDPWGSEYIANVCNTVGNRGVVREVYNNRVLKYQVTWDNGHSNGYSDTNLRLAEIVNV